jgi:hypothetical protein
LPTGPNGELIFRNAGHRGFEVHFHLTDSTGLGYRFPPHSKKHAGVWSQLGAGACPNSEIWEVFHANGVQEPGGMILEVLNPNPSVSNPPNPPEGQGQFGYTLRVTKDGGTTYLPLDPGGDNQNGPITRFDWQKVVVFVAGAIAGTLATLGGQALIQG